MTESEWLISVEPKALFYHLGPENDRKLRLLVANCFRRVWNCLSHPKTQGALEFLEGVTPNDYSASEAERDAENAVWECESLEARIVARAIADVLKDSRPLPFHMPCYEDMRERVTRYVDYPINTMNAIVRSLRLGSLEKDPDKAVALESKHQCHFLRDIFGNPFRPVTIDPAWLVWRNGAVVKLAQSAYQERALPSGELEPERLAVLADALEEAGCTDAQILGHLRSPGPHVRGCWVVDLFLGKC